MFNKVFLSPPTLGAHVIFRKHGFEVVSQPTHADAIVLCGGEDINPKLYNQPPIPSTSWSDARDNREIRLINEHRGKKTFIGICRGAQLLNVYAGGSLYQDVNNHAGGCHIVHVCGPGVRERSFISNSVHHQLMIPGPTGDVLGTTRRSTYRRYGGLSEKGETVIIEQASTTWADPEILYYQTDDFFCFQGHPEFGHKITEDTFFDLLHEIYQK